MGCREGILKKAREKKVGGIHKWRRKGNKKVSGWDDGEDEKKMH